MKAGRIRLGLLFLGLSILLPAAWLSHYSLQQIEWEAFYQLQQQAKLLTRQMEARLEELAKRESRRPRSHWQYWSDPLVPRQGQTGPLAVLPDSLDIPGLIGYFELDGEGRLCSPILPCEEEDNAGLSIQERSARMAWITRLREAFATPSTEPEAGAVAEAEASLVDRQEKQVQLPARSSKLSVPEVPLDVLPLDRRQYRKTDAAQADTFQEEERVAGPAPLQAPLMEAQGFSEDSGSPFTKDLFTSSSPPLQLVLMGETYLLLYRLYDDGHVQGLLLDAEAFTDEWLAGPWAEAGSGFPGRLLIAWEDRVLASYHKPDTDSGLASYRRASQARARDLRETPEALRGVNRDTSILVLEQRLPQPWQSLQVILTVDKRPGGTGRFVVLTAFSLLLLIILAGFWMIDRTARRQMDLMHRQQNFVAAVSHELKTPLTAIRMHAEMLHQGWTPAEKTGPYAEVILRESERLSRLINQVLLLARTRQQKETLDIQRVSIYQFLERLRPTLDALAKAHEFRIDWRIQKPDASESGFFAVAIDADALQQILLNLTENAIKFSAPLGADQVRISLELLKQQPVLSVRDFGPGIEPAKARHIFEPFYRGEDELTRTTQGTGIGLALVAELAKAMSIRVGLEHCHPGSCFRLIFSP